MSRYEAIAAKFGRWLTPRRMFAQATILAACLWTLAAIDFSIPAVMDRAGNVKFQDFLVFYVSAHQVRENGTGGLYNGQLTAGRMHAIAPEWKSPLPMAYGPQIAALFAPLASLPFLTAATVWVIAGTVIYFTCCFYFWKLCPSLREHVKLVIMLVLAYPPFFHFVVRGQLSSIALACFSAAYFAWRAKRPFVAGLALGCLIFKPQFLLAIPIVLLLAADWSALAGTVFSAAAQLGVTLMWVGTETMRSYWLVLSNLTGLAVSTEVRHAYAQMHSLRSFWGELLPWPAVVWVLYAASSLAVLVMAARLWKSRAPLSLRYPGLVLAAVLVNPHLFVYDLLVLAPALLVLTDWSVQNIANRRTPVLWTLLYAAFVLPLLGPITVFTHLQLSVVVYVALEWELWRIARDRTTEPHFVLDSNPGSIA